ncbi:MAG: hypothetical protein AAF253_11790 [Pseudomonadota bacterium]
MDLLTQFNADMATYSPAWVGIWVNVMGVVLLAGAVVFSPFRVEARWVLLGTLLGMVGTLIAYSQVGYSRLLGIGHIVFWTPTLVYLISRRDRWRIGETWSGKWLALAAVVFAISLAFDFVDLARWLLGERSVGA